MQNGSTLKTCFVYVQIRNTTTLQPDSVLLFIFYNLFLIIIR